MQELAQKRGGRCLSNGYKNNATPLQWQCAEGHNWNGRPMDIKRGTWCAKCAGKAKIGLEALHKIAKSRGGILKSTEYKNSVSKLHWMCSLGHEWHAAASNVKRNGSWCPQCSSFLNERLCRTAFEQIFQHSFAPAWPEWLRTNEGNKLQLDGYNETLRIAFEYQGRQHFEKNSRTMRTETELNKRKLYDETKKVLCAKQDIRLFIISHKIRVHDFKSEIINQCRLHDIPVTIEMQACELDFSLAYAGEDTLVEMRDLAISRGGKLLSEMYFGIEEKMQWQCAKGHKWSASANNVKNSKQWCPKCGRDNARKKLCHTLDDMKKLAITKGGKCLSKSYVNIMTHLEWECAEGHTWFALPTHIRNSGSWCPECARKVYGQYRKLNIEKMQKIAEKRGGKFISSKYEGSDKKHFWECRDGHTWDARPSDVIHKESWCPECYSSSRKSAL